MSFILSVGRPLTGAVTTADGCCSYRAARASMLGASDDYVVLFNGEFYFKAKEQVVERIRNASLESVLDTLGEYCLAYYDPQRYQVSFATDRSGRENLFYYHNGSVLIVSDDFWMIVDAIKATSDDIDLQSIQEYALFHYPLFYRTIIKDLHFLPPASIATFSLQTGALSVQQYWDLRYQPREQSLDQAVQTLDNSLANAFAQIAELNPGAEYGVGLSGGLDSRLIPHYALRTGMKLHSFIIGERSPNHLFLSRDHKSARELARLFDIPHHEVEWDADSFENKLYRDLRRFPIGPSQFFISLHDQAVPSFDVLLTGASGMLVGAEVPPGIHDFSEEQVVQAILSHGSIARFSRLPDKFVRGFKEVLGVKHEVKRSTLMLRQAVMSDSAYEVAESKVRAFVSERMGQGKNGLEAYQDYFYFYLGSRNKFGAFESIQGQRKSYSIYSPFLLDESLTWKPEFLYGRLILKRLIAYRLPEATRIKAQDHKVSLAQEGVSSSLQRATALAEFALRGPGVGRQEIWAQGRRYREYARGIWERPNKTFDRIFDTEYLAGTRAQSPRFFEKLVKIKGLLDLLDTGEYQRLL